MSENPMPELPEVETTRKGLIPALVGETFSKVDVRSSGLRFPFPRNLSSKIQNRRVISINRRAKYLLICLEGDLVLLIHLGMSGRMRVFIKGDKIPPIDKHDHLIFRTLCGTEVRFNDARRFGALDLVSAKKLNTHPLICDLGPEPLSESFNGTLLAERIIEKKTNIKAALLDQKTIAGIGNIYACEALYYANLSPRRAAYTIQGKRADRLASSIQGVLKAAIKAGGSSLRDFRQSDGGLGYFQHQFAVYGREGELCPRCKAANHNQGCVNRTVQNGRSTFYCSCWQR
jgi:formamidopyrimidine-DNA glycosylase|tara:strand:+ start:28741 stop:29604 length:864 start_codon:yes stop_codon:yes gene_type:complete